MRRIKNSDIEREIATEIDQRRSNPQVTKNNTRGKMFYGYRYANYDSSSSDIQIIEDADPIPDW